jgi:hypothetical protein
MPGTSQHGAIAGTLQLIPLSGAATKGGKLLFCATWSIDAGDGIDDKCVFITDQGEVLIFYRHQPVRRQQLAPGRPLSGAGADGQERPRYSRRRPPDRDR